MGSSGVNIPICLLTCFPGTVITVLLMTSPMAASLWRSVAARSTPVDASLISIAETVVDEVVLYS